MAAGLGAIVSNLGFVSGPAEEVDAKASDAERTRRLRNSSVTVGLCCIQITRTVHLTIAKRTPSGCITHRSLMHTLSDRSHASVLNVNTRPRELIRNLLPLPGRHQAKDTPKHLRPIIIRHSNQLFRD